MSEPIRYESIQEPLDDEERELMDPDNWDWENPVEVIVHPDFGFIFPVRFTSHEIGRLEPVARAEGLIPHEFIKQAALARLPQDVSRSRFPNPSSTGAIPPGRAHRPLIKEDVRTSLGGTRRGAPP